MANWRDREFEEITVECPGGHRWGPTTANYCGAALMNADERWRKENGREGAPFYAYGDHVSDPRAIVIRYLGLLGWRPVPGSVTRMTCPEHQEKQDGK